MKRLCALFACVFLIQQAENYNFDDLRTETDGLDTNRTFFEGTEENFKQHVVYTFPSTRWCGAVDTSRKVEDLSYFDENNHRCCREHDICSNDILQDDIKYGLQNTGLLTRYHCSCDTKFYSCLRKTRSVVSYEIGYTYFTLVGPQCFKEEYPTTGCIQYYKERCLEYTYDTTGSTTYQWFDNPVF